MFDNRQVRRSTIGPDQATTDQSSLTKFDVLSTLQTDFRSFETLAQEARREATACLWDSFPQDLDCLPPEARPIRDHIDMHYDRVMGLYGDTTEEHGTEERRRHRFKKDSIAVQSELYAMEKEARMRGDSNRLESPDGGTQIEGSLFIEDRSLVQPCHGTNFVISSKVVEESLSHLEDISALGAVLAARHWAWSVDGELAGESEQITSWWNKMISSELFGLCSCPLDWMWLKPH